MTGRAARATGDLFDYPATPGFKEPITSRAAAEQIAGKVPRLQARVLAALDRHGPMTADETAAKIDEDILSIRPRFSELRRAGSIEPTGERRPSSTGSDAHVWRTIAPAGAGG